MLEDLGSEEQMLAQAFFEHLASIAPDMALLSTRGYAITCTASTAHSIIDGSDCGITMQVFVRWRKCIEWEGPCKILSRGCGDDCGGREKWTNSPTTSVRLASFSYPIVFCSVEYIRRSYVVSLCEPNYIQGLVSL
jgi:hypothetical protein